MTNPSPTEPGRRFPGMRQDRPRRFFAFVVRHRVAVVALTLALSAGFALQLPNLTMDPDTEAYIPKGHPIRVFWKQAKEEFAVGKDIFVGIKADGPNGIFTPEILSAIKTMTEGIKNLDPVIDTDVRSLATSDAVRAAADGLEIEPFYEDPPTTLEEARAIREQVFDNGVYVNRLVSADGSIGAIIVQAHDAYDADSPYAHPVEVFQAVSDYINGIQIPGAEIVVAGNTAVEAAFGRQMAADLAKLIPTALMVVVVTMFLCFRVGPLWKFFVRAGILAAALVGWNLWSQQISHPFDLLLLALALSMLTVRGVALPSLIVVLALVWTWGTQAMLALPIYIEGTLVPPILLATGSADAIHVLERYFDAASSSDDRTEVVVSTMSALWRPMVLTSLTTAIGFASLTLGSMTVYQVFGFTTALGIMIALVLSLVLLPALLAMLPLPATASRRSISVAPAVLMRLGAFLQRHRGAVVATSGVAMVALGVAATDLHVDYSWVESLEPGSQVLEADRLLRTRHGGTMPMNIVVRAKEAGGVKDPALLRGIDHVLADLSAHPEVGDTRSIAEYIKRMNEAMNGNRPGTLRIPDDRDLVAQYLLLYSLSGNPTELDDMIDYDYQGAQLGVLLRSDKLSVMSEVIGLADRLLDKYVRPLGAEAVITGSAMIQKTVLDLIVSSQIYSLTTAAVLVFVFLLVLFRSFTDALFCMIPPIFTGVVNFGTMALAGRALGPGEAMVGAIALGIGVDYSIHLMAKLRETLAQGMSIDEGVIESMRTTGRAILFNGIVVVAGFTVMALSKSPANASLGIQLAANMGLCCLAALVLLPAALSMISHERVRRAEASALSMGSDERVLGDDATEQQVATAQADPATAQFGGAQADPAARE